MEVWAFYGRVSGIEQAMNNSIPTQREACHQKAREKGASQTIDFVDAGVPGDLEWADRPALTQLLDLVEKRALAGVVIYDPDRLARDLGVQLAVTDIIIKHGVQLEFCTQQYDASPEGMLFYQLRGAISQFERAKIRERTNRGRKKMLREGRPANLPRPFGLQYHPDSNTWTIIEGQAEVIRRVYSWARAGDGPSAIAHRLNGLGVTPPREVKSAQWWTATVRRILTNPIYTGTFYVHRWNFEGHRKNRFLSKERRSNPKERPRAEWIGVPIPPIVIQDEWDAVQEFLGQNRRRWAGIDSPEYVYLGSRLMTCSLCGSAMNGASVSRTGGRVRYYRCNGRYGERRLPCQMPHLRADRLDEALWQEVRAWLVDPERYRRAVATVQIAKDDHLASSDEAVGRQLQEIRSDIARLGGLVEQGIVREHEVRSALRSLRERELSLVATLRGSEPKATPTFAALPEDAVDKLDASERREHIRGVVCGIRAFPDGRLELTPRGAPVLPVVIGAVSEN